MASGLAEHFDQMFDEAVKVPQHLGMANFNQVFYHVGGFMYACVYAVCFAIERAGMHGIDWLCAREGRVEEAYEGWGQLCWLYLCIWLARTCSFQPTLPNTAPSCPPPLPLLILRQRRLTARRNGMGWSGSRGARVRVQWY